MGLRESMRELFTGKKTLEVTNFTNAGQYDDPFYQFGRVLDTAHLNIGTQSPDQLWREQPYLRILVTFLARNIAQLGLQTFERVSETDRRRLRDDPMALLLAHPNANMTAYELIYALVADLALYDVAYWSFGADLNTPSGYSLVPIPPAWVQNLVGGDMFAAGGIIVTPPNGRRVQIDAENLIMFHGWNPGSPATGSSPVNALRDILREQISAWAYRQQVWDRGGRVGAVLTRPASAPQWSPEAQARFSADWKAKYGGNEATNAGGTPILEDGMTLEKISFSAREDDWVNAAKLSLATVAAVYHVNPTMVGLLDNANYSNVREFRRMLYGDTLGPTMAMIEDRVNTFVVPRVAKATTAYVEFNIGEKLQGSFEEQAAALQSAVGRPWMSADEARAKMNLPAMGGEADQLVIPLNVLVGGQASPQDSGTQNIGKGRPALTLVKARAGDQYEKRVEEMLTDFFDRQSNVVLSALGAKAASEYWDAERWDGELSDDLLRLSTLVSTEIGQKTAEHLGFAAGDYDVDRTLAFLRKVADTRAANINATTKTQIDAALAAGGDVAAVFDTAKSQRATSAAVQLVSAYSGFATIEAAKQVTRGSGTKTWLAGPHARPSHSAINGETVGIEDTFSNGLNWPGDGGDAAEVAGCNCSVNVSS